MDGAFPKMGCRDKPQSPLFYSFDRDEAVPLRIGSIKAALKLYWLYCRKFIVTEEPIKSYLPSAGGEV
jgi:hypothetical protein